jgi:hypothetical protein
LMYAALKLPLVDDQRLDACRLIHDGRAYVQMYTHIYEYQ